MSKPHGGPGIAFVGAMNEDVVCTGSPARIIQEELESEDQRLRQYTESHISDELSDKLLSLLPAGQWRHQLGGSAFNALRAAVPFSPHMRLGFVGVSGESSGKHPHAEYCRRWGVETDLVELSGRPPARSISFTHDGDRTLLTSLGANSEARDLFRDRRSEVVEYLSGFDVVHVTSFLDSDTPAELATVLSDLRAQVPKMTISVDPGSVWCENPTAPVIEIIRAASMLHLNAGEFAHLGGRVRNEGVEAVAARIGQMMAPDDLTLVVRRHDSILLFARMGRSAMNMSTVLNRHFMPSELVVDATGAGDTVVGALLVCMTSPILSLAFAARFGMAMAAAKIGQRGPLEPDEVVAIVSDQIGDLPSELMAVSRRDGKPGVA